MTSAGVDRETSMDRKTWARLQVLYGFLRGPDSVIHVDQRFEESGLLMLVLAAILIDSIQHLLQDGCSAVIFQPFRLTRRHVGILP